MTHACIVPRCLISTFTCKLQPGCLCVQEQSPAVVNPCVWRQPQVLVTDVAVEKPGGAYDYERKDSADNAAQLLLPKSSTHSSSALSSSPPPSDAKQLPGLHLMTFWRRRSSPVEGTELHDAPVWASIEVSQPLRALSLSTPGLTLRTARSANLGNVEHGEAMLRVPLVEAAAAAGTPSKREEYLRADATLTVDKMLGGSAPSPQQSPKVRPCHD